MSVQIKQAADLAAFVKDGCGPYGLWEYGPNPEASRRVTFDLSRFLSRLEAEGDWVSKEPRTPFQPYPARHRRYSEMKAIVWTDGFPVEIGDATGSKERE